MREGAAASHRAAWPGTRCNDEGTGWTGRDAKSTGITAHMAAWRWRSSAGEGQQRGAQNMMNGATC